MRTLPYEQFEALLDDDPGSRFLDWKDHPDMTLEAVDDLLVAFGLEVVQYDTGQDAYRFKIEKRQPTAETE